MDLSHAGQVSEDSLITYPEFMQALKATKSRHKPTDGSQNSESLFKTLLPRTLSFAEVLLSKPREDEYSICDT